MKKVRTEKLSYADAAWERMLAQLGEYRRLYGHVQVPVGCKGFRKLSYWVQHQRVLRRKGLLLAKRKRRLQQFGFEWVSRGRSLEFRDSSHWTAKWDRMFAKLATFKQQSGHCVVPVLWRGSPQLAHWASRQRRLKQRGLLNKDRQRKLDTLGFDWTTSEAAGPRWQRCYLRLVEFHRRFGHCHVPAEWAENINLGRWVVKTRRLRKAGLLSAYKLRRLRELGFVWEPLRKRKTEHDAVWSQALARLLAFHQKYGHWRVPTDQRRFHQLRVWMDNQRISQRRGWLAKDRVRTLEKYGFSWLSDRARGLVSAKPPK